MLLLPLPVPVSLPSELLPLLREPEPRKPEPLKRTPRGEGVLRVRGRRVVRKRRLVKVGSMVGVELCW